MIMHHKNSAVSRKAERQRLWNPVIERGIVDDSLLSTIYCKAECGFSEKAFFGTKGQKKCPKCKSAGLTVSAFNHRNAPVANATEKFAQCLIQSAINESRDLRGQYFAKRGIICHQLGLTGKSGADVAILKEDVAGPVKPELIECLFEIKMSVIWNWHERDLKRPTADYDCHAGRPSIYRTDSILKATGKAAITRSYPGGDRIPFVIVGNTPPPVGYRPNIDGTVKSGLIQRWISLTPNPLTVAPKKSPSKRNPKTTAGSGFLRIDEISELQDLLVLLLGKQWQYMGAMTSAERIGKIIKSLDLNRSAAEIGNEFLLRLPEANATSQV